MTARELDRIESLLAPLLEALDALGQVARRLHPPALAGLVAQAARAQARWQTAWSVNPPWPEPWALLGAQLDACATEAMASFEGLRAATAGSDALAQAYRALRHLPRALEALYPLAGLLGSVNRFFLDPAGRADESLQRRLLGEAPEHTGLMAFGDSPGSRQGVWVYVPETYRADRDWPLVMALHGGGGRGRAFLWSWLRDARARGAILVAPTSLGPTWALAGDDEDSPHLMQILDFVREHWRVDPARLLLTGMSDGGTFCYASGLEPSSPFTHLAPVSAAFHPMLAQMADPARLRGLPIHIVHGSLDWMFPVAMAREAAQALSAAGARASLREIADLSHVYPGEVNGSILDWLDQTAGATRDQR